jgi:hypothetical protein
MLATDNIAEKAEANKQERPGQEEDQTFIEPSTAPLPSGRSPEEQLAAAVADVSLHEPHRIGSPTDPSNEPDVQQMEAFVQSQPVSAPDVQQMEARVQSLDSAPASESSDSSENQLEVEEPSNAIENDAEIMRHLHSLTPCTSEQDALAPDTLARDGPVTPTNDAGPFVFDGGGGRRNTRGSIASFNGAAAA